VYTETDFMKLHMQVNEFVLNNRVLFRVFSLKNAINTLHFVTSSTMRGFKFQLNPYVRVDHRNLNVAQ
jgi:hypothetical protein